MAYPKVFVSNYDHHAKVVVMNAEQEADIPSSFHAEGDGIVTSGAALADSKKTVVIRDDSPVISREQLAGDRKSLQSDRNEFAELLSDAQSKLDDDRQLLERERQEFELAKQNFIQQQTLAQAEENRKVSAKVKADPEAETKAAAAAAANAKQGK